MTDIVTLILAGMATLIAKLASSVIKGRLQKGATEVYEVKLGGGRPKDIEIVRKPGDTLDFSMQQVLDQAVKCLKDGESGESKEDLSRLASDLEALRPAQPYSGMLHITLGRLYRRQNDLAQAVKILSEYIRTKENAKQRDIALAAAYYNRSCYEALRHGDPKLYLEDLKRALELNPNYNSMARSDPDFGDVRTQLQPILTPVAG